MNAIYHPNKILKFWKLNLEIIQETAKLSNQLPVNDHRKYE